MRRKLKRVVTITVVAIGALAVAVIATLSSLDYNAYRDTVAAEIARATGREVEIAGALELAIGFKPSLSVTGVSFANAAGGSRPEMATFERLEARVRLWPLLSGEIDVDRLVVVGADILLERDENGVGNWMFLGESSQNVEAAGTPTIPALNEIVVRRSRLTYADGQRRHRIRIDSLTAETTSGETPLAVGFSGAVDAQPVSLRGALGALRRLRDDRSFPLDITLTAAGARIGVEGVIARPLQGRGFDLAITASAADLTALSELTQAGFPVRGPIEVSLTLTDSDERYRMRDLVVRLGESDLAGDLDLALGRRARVTGTLSSTKLDLADLSPGKAAADTIDGRIFPDWPLPVTALQRFDVDIVYRASEFVLGGAVFHDLRTAIALADGQLSLKAGQAVLADGRLDFVAGLDAAKPRPRLSFDASLAGADLARLWMETAESDLLAGTLDMQLKGIGAGASLRQIMAGLDGRANAVVVEGYITKGHVDLLAADLLTSLVPGERDVAGSKINCFVADFPVTRGLAKARVLLLDTERMIVTGAGTVDLGSERIQVQLKPKPKDASLLSLATPVNLRGTIANPTVTPDAAGLAAGAAGAVVGNLILPGVGLLLPLLSPGSGGEHPCLRAVGAEAPAPAGASKSNGLGGFLKGLGDRIDKALGVDK